MDGFIFGTVCVKDVDIFLKCYDFLLLQKSSVFKMI